MDLKVAAANLLLQKGTCLSSMNKNALVEGRWERNGSVPPNARVRKRRVREVSKKCDYITSKLYLTQF